MTKEEYLYKHEMVDRLKKKGLTIDNLKSISLNSTKGTSFLEWTTNLPPDLPNDDRRPGLLYDCVMWALLKYLILENPPYSIKREVAYSRVSAWIAEPEYEAGRKHLGHAKKAGEKSQADALNVAHKFCCDVEELLRKQPQLSKTGALKRVAKEWKISNSTAWKHMERVK